MKRLERRHRCLEQQHLELVFAESEHVLVLRMSSNRDARSGQQHRALPEDGRHETGRCTRFSCEHGVYVLHSCSEDSLCAGKTDSSFPWQGCKDFEMLNDTRDLLHLQDVIVTVVLFKVEQNYVVTVREASQQTYALLSRMR